MCLLVVDPHLLLRALTHHHSQEAKLLSLLIYGLACRRVHALRDESDELVRAAGSSAPSSTVRARLERQHACARHQKTRIERAFEQHIPIELLLVTSAPLRQELRDIARAAQANGRPHVRPDRVNREIARCTWRPLSRSELELAPPYLGRGRASPRAYLLHTAVIGEAESVITDDEALVLPGDASDGDPTTGRPVRSHTLADFCHERLPSQLDFEAIDAPAVFRAARQPARSRRT